MKSPCPRVSLDELTKDGEIRSACFHARVRRTGFAPDPPQSGARMATPPSGGDGKSN